MFDLKIFFNKNEIKLAKKFILTCWRIQKCLSKLYLLELDFLHQQLEEDIDRGISDGEFKFHAAI